jgi:predicted transcriptional regulator
MKSGRIEQFSHLSQFDSIKAFNYNIETFLSVHKRDFTKSELIAFKRLVRFCAKYYGVANAKIAKVVVACTDHGGISRSTFERMLRKAKKLHILTIHNTLRNKGGHGHNVFVFNRFDRRNTEILTEGQNPEKSCSPSIYRPQSSPETIHLSKTHKTKEQNRIQEKLDHTFTSDTVPVAFRNLVKCFFNDAAVIEQYYTRVRIAAYKFVYEKEPWKMTDVAIESFKQLIGKIKKGKVRDPFAYFYRICEKKFEDLYFSEMSEFYENVEIPEGHWLLW